MASQNKEYYNKKFDINEIRDTFIKIISSINSNSEKKGVFLSYDFIKDGISDTDKLTLNETGRITEIPYGNSLNLYIQPGRSVSLSKWYPTFDILAITVHGQNANEVKEIFSIIESELNLKELKKDTLWSAIPKVVQKNEDKSIPNNKNKEDFQIEDTDTEFQIEFGPVQLYKEDLIEIIDLIYGFYEKIYIKIDSYKITNKSQIDDVRRKLKKNSVNDLTISTEQYAHNSRLSLSFSGFYAKMIVDDKNDYESMGISRLLEKLISKKENNILKILSRSQSGFVYGFFLVLLCVMIPYLLIKNVTPLINGLIISIVWILIFVSLFIYIGWITLNRYSVIYLTNSTEESWLKSHSSEILIPLIVTIVGTILATVILNLFHIK